MISKRIIVAVLALGILAIVVALVAAFWQPSGLGTNGGPKPSGPQQVKILNHTDVDPSKLPDKIPSDLPLESRAVVLQNYTAQTSGGTQSTRMYASNQSMASAYKAFVKYFDQNNWVVKSTVDQPTLKEIFGTKGNMSLQVTITQNTVTNQRLVNVTATY